MFFEDLVAPDYTHEALDVLRRKADLRVFATHADQGTRGPNGVGADAWRVRLQARCWAGSWCRRATRCPSSRSRRRVVTQRHPVLAELTSLYFAWRAVKHVTSNGVVLAKGLSLVGFGVGPAESPGRGRPGVPQSGRAARGLGAGLGRVLPVPDAVERAADAGVTAIIQPGGSSRDPELIRAANRHGMAMIFTGERHYRH